MVMEILSYIGAAMAFVGMIWLIILSIKSGKSIAGKAFWAIANFAFQPIAGIVFYIMRRNGLIALLMLIFGWILLMTGWLSASGHLAQMLSQ